MAKAKLLLEVGRPHGHVPGHQYLDVAIHRRRRDYTLTIVWGSAQGRGRDEEYGREEYARDSIDELRVAALAGQAATEGAADVRGLIERACSEARGAGRPRESASGELQEATIRVRMPPAQKARLEQLAAEAGLKLSDYVRGKLL